MDPLEEYVGRRDRWRAQSRSLQRIFIRIGNWRLTLGILEALLAWLAFGPALIPSWILFLPLIAFVALAIWHTSVIRRRTRAERAVRFYEAGLARLDDRWMGNGTSGEAFRSSDHVYADDLDLFGKGSLFELAASTRTAAGERTLADWLLAPADRTEAIARQEAAKELSTRLDLREDIAMLGEEARAELHTDVLAAWGSMPPIAFPLLNRVAAASLAVAGPVVLIAFFLERLPLWPFLAVLAADLLFAWAHRERVARVTATIEAPAQSLRILALILHRLEPETFTSQRLAQLRSALNVADVPASARIRRLERWIDWLDSSDHLLVRIIAPLLLWREQLAMVVENWRRLNGPLLASWLQAIAEFEALSSFASLAFEHPGWCFPTLLPEIELRFEAQAMAHPLIAASRAVPNDLALNSHLQLLIVSGSNMSGKSTLLRAVGLNCVLAWAGAPVAAKQFIISPLQPGASIRVADSLQDNRSRFFAEIVRLRQILDLTKSSRPVLFLLDELLSGTNSHDRRIGAAGIVARLVQSGAIGLITTHDLALATIEQDLSPLARNVHFEDQMVDGHMNFDYHLRQGVVTRSNALALMRAVGLDV